MMAKTDIVKVYGTILSMPGMNDTIKLTVQTNRKNILLLKKVIEKAIAEVPDERSIAFFEAISTDAFNELIDLSNELLGKAGLTEVNEKLSSL